MSTRPSGTLPPASGKLSWELPAKPWTPRILVPEHFGPEVSLTVTTGDKLDVLRRIGAFGLIDDKPETLILAVEAGFWTAAKIQPWNKALVTQNPTCSASLTGVKSRSCSLLNKS